MFTKQDLDQIQTKGITVEKVNGQIKNFKQGFPFMTITGPAVPSNGILQLSNTVITDFSNTYDEHSKNIKVVKFVPASGAASRMFKTLFEFVNTFNGSTAALIAYEADKSANSIYQFINRIKDFAFFNDLNIKYIEKYDKDLDEALDNKEYVHIVDLLLSEDGLNYGQNPKGMLLFHNYTDGNRTPLEEHLAEAALYAKSNQDAYIHFTVSSEHKSGFLTLAEKVIPKYEKLFNVKYHISYSEQKPSTDTIAVANDNTPFRNADSSILFRPGGHGALIENLNDIDADVVFIKNIDNVVPDSLKRETIQYKKAIAGVLVSFQKRIFDYLTQLEKNTDDTLLEEIVEFLELELFVKPPGNFESEADKLAFVKNKLNRPIRVCGMVKNEGEPGGGPFWATNQDGSLSLQVVESSQIDLNDSEKQTMVGNATHFNPVDLVCAVKNYKGKAFDLTKFIDPQAGFISEKSKDGKELRALELPGLWNGAMSDWNTFFVEVPLITFNPVKTVNDLLRNTHQA